MDVEEMAWMWVVWNLETLLVLPHITLCPCVLLLFLYSTHYALTFDIYFWLFMCHVPYELECKFHKDQGYAAISGTSVCLQHINISFITCVTCMCYLFL